RAIKYRVLGNLPYEGGTHPIEPFTQKESTRMGGSRTLRQRFAYQRIKDMLLKCELAPGVPVVERELAKKLGMSRTPVREALAELAREGLIRTVGTRARIVAEPSIRDVIELFDIREAVDGMAARLLALRVTPAQLAELTRLARGADAEQLSA